MSNQDDLPVKDSENFVAEFEVMDLSPLKDNQFMVAVGTGKRDSAKILPSTLHGPYDFYEMCQEVGMIWRNDLHHAKVLIVSKDRKVRPKVLDENTTDYIEAHFENIIVDGMLEGVFEEKQFTCRANLIEANPEEDKK
jgi:hypothetical protein